MINIIFNNKNYNNYNTK